MTQAESQETQSLTVLHCDMDAFYAAVEQRDRAELRGRPVIVGAPPERRGVVATCSYEAREYGVHSAMPSSQAVELCPKAVFVRPRFDHYRQVSEQVQAVFARAAEAVEPLSLDEAYLAVPDRAQRRARWIRTTVQEETGLTVSVGVSYNKFLAKLASDWDKPDGLTVITRGRARRLLPDLEVDRLWGVGPKTAERLRGAGITTCGELRQVSRRRLHDLLGPARAERLRELAAGRDARSVEAEQRRKSISVEHTFQVDIPRLSSLMPVLERFAGDLAGQLAARDMLAGAVGVKVRYDTFDTRRRSRRLRRATRDDEVIAGQAQALLRQFDISDEKPVRLIGLRLSRLVHPGEPVQTALNFGNGVSTAQGSG